MARPIKEGLDYFPLDVDIDQDDKVAMIEAIYGHEGFAVVIKLLAKIYKEGYFYEWSKREQLLFSKRVNVNINTLNQIVNECINEGLFNKNVFEKYEVLTSKGIQKRYLEAVKRRKQVIFIEKYFLIEDISSIVGSNKIAVYVVNDDNNRVNVNINPTNEGVNTEFSTQRKEKKRKEKKSKENTTTEISNSNFSEIMNFYQNNLQRGVTETPYNLELLVQWYDDYGHDLLLAAMKVSAKAEAKGIKFLEGVLKNWKQAGVKTLEDARKYQSEFKDQKGSKPPKKEDFNLND